MILKQKSTNYTNKYTNNIFMKITKDITIEELIELEPQSVKYLMEKGIKCIACGEPVWGTLEDAAREKGLSDTEIEEIVSELEKFTN